MTSGDCVNGLTIRFTNHDAKSAVRISLSGGPPAIGILAMWSVFALNMKTRVSKRANARNSETEGAPGGAKDKLVMDYDSADEDIEMPPGGDKSAKIPETKLYRSLIGASAAIFIGDSTAVARKRRHSKTTKFGSRNRSAIQISGM